MKYWCISANKSHELMTRARSTEVSDTTLPEWVHIFYCAEIYQIVIKALGTSKFFALESLKFHH